jgi:polyferredoxin
MKEKSKNDIEERIKTIEERNKRVEADKAWETSWTRRLSIATITYFFALGFLFAINNDAPFFNAVVPTMGYLLSTLLLKSIRKVWEKS